MSLWVNSALGDTVQMIAVRTPDADGNMSAETLTTFRTKFTDGTEIVTSNGKFRGIFPVNPRVDALLCPGVGDVERLYSFHRARVARDAGPRVATLDGTADGPAYMRKEWRDTFDRLAKLGYYRIDTGADQYRMTLKGAFLTTYRLLSPFRQIQAFRRAAKSNRALKELGFVDLEHLRSRPSLTSAK